VTSWSFLTSHAQVLLCIARDPGARLTISTPGEIAPAKSERPHTAKGR
jgi:hypothetical protein